MSPHRNTIPGRPAVSIPRPHITATLLAAALGLAASLPVMAGGLGGAGLFPGGKGGGLDNAGKGESNDPLAGLPGLVDLNANIVLIFTANLDGVQGDTNFVLGHGGGGGGAGAFVGGANAHVTVQSVLQGGMGGAGVIDDAGSGGGGDALAVLSGTVINASTGTLLGGSSNLALRAAGGGGGNGLSLGNGALFNRNGGQIIGGEGGQNLVVPLTPLSANGGEGGAGVFVTRGYVVNEGMIQGGQGGWTQTAGARGGAGGAGVVIMTGAGQPGGQPDLDNQRNATITGGRGAQPILPLTAGAAGVGVYAGNNVYIRNQGTIRAGQDGNGISGIAVLMQGDGNRLELWSSSDTAGDVISIGRNTLAVGSANGQPASARITGRLILSPTSTYEVRANAAGQADRLIFNNQAQLAGTVKVIAGAGTYAESTAYTILSAASLSGNFTSATSNLAFLAPSVANVGTDVVLTMDRRTIPDPGTAPGTSPGTDSGTALGTGTGTGSRPMRFEDAANNRNQRAAANAIEAMPSNAALYSGVLNLPTGTPASAFQALSGESHASAANTLNNVAAITAAVPVEHFRNSFNAAFTAGAPTAAAGASDAPVAPSVLPQSNARPIWAQVIGNWQRTSATGETTAVRQHTGGLFMGAHRTLASGWRVGGAVGYTDAKANTDTPDSKSDIGSYSLALYGGKSFDMGPGSLNFLAGGAYTWHDLDTKRQINAGSINQTLKASYGANTSQLFTELGYALPVNSALTLEPFGGVTWSDQRIRGFSESGGYAALSGQSQRNDLTTTSLGLRARQALTLGSVSGVLRGGLGWRHTFGDIQPRTTVAFDGSPTFSVLGAPIARDAMMVELSLDADLSRNTTLAFGYGGQFGSGNSDQTGTVTLRWKF